MPVQIEKGIALSTLSLTPLIDVVFLLLIFFLVASRFAEEDRELDVPLPEASEAQPLTVTPREMFINIDRDGNYFVSGSWVNLPQLEQLLVQAAANNPQRQAIIIRADKRVEFDHVVQAVNACKKAGIEDYMVNTAGTSGTPEAEGSGEEGSGEAEGSGSGDDE